MIRSVALLAVALLGAASPEQCLLEDFGSQCGEESTPGRDHLLLQVGTAGGSSSGAVKHRPKSAHALKQKHRRRIEDVATKSVGSLAAVSRQEDRRSRQTLDTSPASSFTDREQRALDSILESVSYLPKKDRLDGNGQQGKVMEIVGNLEADESVQVGAGKDVDKDVQVLKAAIEDHLDVAEPDDAVGMGQEVTADLLQKLDGLKETPETTKALGAFQGDIISGLPGDAGWGLGIWPRDKLYFCFAQDIHEKIETVFLRAVAHIESRVPCIKFQQVTHKSGKSGDPDSEKKCDAPNAIFVQSNKAGGCNSYAGMQKEADGDNVVTPLQLAPDGCDSMGSAVHQLCQALGMQHESARPDRDTYVKILWDNVKEGAEKNFEKINAEQFHVRQPFDANSVMMFGEHHFAKAAGKPTLQLISGDGTGALGNRMGLSVLDAEKLADMYGCSAQSQFDDTRYSTSTWPTCSTDPGVCSSEDCVCNAPGQALIKVSDMSMMCWSCMPQCPTDGNTCSADENCACPAGMERKTDQAKDGTTCSSCHLPQPTGTATATSMTHEVKKLLSRMPFKDIKKKIEESFAKHNKVTIERGEGTIEATIHNKDKDEKLGGKW